MSAFDTLFLSSVYSSFFAPIVRRIVTIGFGVGNRAGWLVKTISTIPHYKHDVFSLGEGCCTYRTLTKSWSQKHLRVTKSDALREIRIGMHHLTRIEWLGHIDALSTVIVRLHITHQQRSYSSRYHFCRRRHCDPEKMVQSTFDHGLEDIHKLPDGHSQ